ncbi:MAG: YggT family protein [Wolbachia endosymbiont of Tyrophagus putrescentiae]|nr:YggT family protein [Wolbachia endosymbiont of Tyrophagus putrescentiae]
MHPIIYLISILFDLYSFVLMSWIVLNWLIRLGVLNMYNEVVNRIMHTLNQLTYPPLKFIRKYIPPFNGLDLSVIILLIAMHFIKYTIIYYFQ